MFAVLPYCPFCYSQKIFKSRYRGLERLLPLVLLRPVRCGECSRRHYRPMFYRAMQRPLAQHRHAA